MQKQSGFTLIELMVVMAIIAILATAGIFAYTGYLKHARDAVRIADVGAMDAIVYDYRRLYGYPPITEEVFQTAVTTANLGRPIVDPLNNKVACLTSPGDSTLTYCSYLYIACDDGAGYLISVKFETSSQTQRYTQVPGDPSEWFYNIGQCSAIDIPNPQTVSEPEPCRTKNDCVTTSVCVGPQPKHCRLKTSQGNGASCDTTADCNVGTCQNMVCVAS